jgi:fermentation-respiration switch protein FrsA (DUF1100 family)
MEWWMAGLTKVAAAGLVVYGLVVLAAWLGQRQLMYHPDPTRTPPATIGLRDTREETLVSDDGTNLLAWTTPARPGMPTILYFHGNAGNLAGRANRFARYQAQGFGLYMMSWRGYSGSAGNPSEAANVADAVAAYRVLVARGIAPGSIVVYGESLGSGVAVQLAARHPVGAIVLDAPYTSIVDVAILTYPYLPVRPLLVDRYESDRHIASVRAPVLILHGERDAVIPVEMGRTLYRLANEPKRLATYPQGNHVDLDDYGAVDDVTRWLRSILPDTAPTTRVN